MSESVPSIDHRVDLAMFAIANLVNVLMMAIFLSRATEKAHWGTALGIILTILILPTGLILIHNIMSRRDWWTILFPSLLILFFLVELLLDDILGADFRSSILRWPYLAIYYASFLGMIGYTFSLGKIYGLITLGTYFLNQGATWFSHVHG